MKTISLLLVLLFSSTALAKTPGIAEDVRIIDGDTLEVRILHLGAHVALVDITLRASRYDAWESARYRQSLVRGMSTKEKAAFWEAELQKGIAAKNGLEKLAKGKVWKLVLDDSDLSIYGRMSAEFQLIDPNDPDNPISVADWMQANGHARD